MAEPRQLCDHLKLVQTGYSPKSIRQVRFYVAAVYCKIQPPDHGPKALSNAGIFRRKGHR
ncbi:hypothetical protein OAE56_00230 [Verrucomicrobiales bacterium]|nr:hypothetical protein [Verrucomicrobiales bacterium]